MENSYLSRAFSLIELLVALAIIGVVSSLMYARLSDFRQKALTKIAQEQAASLQQAVDAWIGSYGTLDEASTAFGSDDTLSSDTDLSDFTDDTLDELEFNSSGSYFISNSLKKISAQGSDWTTYNNQQANLEPADATNDEDKRCAHMKVFWDSTARTSSNPTVVLFIPTT